MVHRDPETGQFLAHGDDEPVELTYADHEFVSARFFANHNGPANTEQRSEYKVEDDVLGLENDELGMLSWMTAAITVNSRFSGQQGSEAGVITAEATVGSNLSGQEYLFVGDGGVESTDETDGVSSFGQADDEAGVWASLIATANPAFSDPDLGSGGGSGGHDRLTRHYYDETRGGPYIDSTDDITASIEISKLRPEEDAVATVYTQMAFVIFEYENRRAEFAPYDPGPSGRM